MSKVPLAEQVVLITGASSGIRATVAQQLAQSVDCRRCDRVVEKVAQHYQGSRERGSWQDEEDEGDWHSKN